MILTTPSYSNNLLHALSDTTEVMLFAVRPATNSLLFLNPAFEKMWEISRESLGTDFSLLIKTIHPDDQLYVTETFNVILEKKQKQTLDFRLQFAGGKEKWVRVCACILQQDKEDTIVGTATNVTNDKEYSNTLHKFANKKNTILEILSHDLASPLSIIKVTTQLLREQTKKHQDEQTEDLLNFIRDSSDRGITMIRSFVNHEFLESSEVRLVKQRVDIIEKIEQIIKQYQHSYHLIKQKFHLISTEKRLYISIDEAKFMQVINNLLSNSLKFTREDGEISVIIENSANNILIKIQDNGIGIPAQMQPYLFDKFTKARRPGIKGEPTTGLGMSIIKTIVEWHNGRIWFESKEGKGSTFFIELPKGN